MKYHFPALFSVVCLFALASVPPACGQDNPEKEARQLAEKALELSKAEKYVQAIAAIKKAIALAPRNDQYLALASDCEFKAGQYADGVEHALQAIKLNGKVGAYYVLVAANAYGDQDLERAREYCDKVVKGGKEFGAGPVKDARQLQDMLVKKTYTLFWNLDPQKGKLTNRALTVIVPKGDLPYQTVSYEVTGAQSHRLAKGEANDILYITPQGTKPIALTTKVTVEPYSFKKELASATPKPVPAAAMAYLGPCYSINPRSPALAKLATELKGKSSAETARNIVAWMKKHIEYKLDKKPIDQLDFKAVEEIVERGHAECRGYAMLFVALCRAADIPARPIWGLTRVAPGQDQRFGEIASHNWAEFYVPGCGWVPIDPQRPETFGFLPSTVIRMFMDVKRTKTSGEDLPLLNLLSMHGDKLKFEESR